MYSRLAGNLHLWRALGFQRTTVHCICVQQDSGIHGYFTGWNPKVIEQYLIFLQNQWPWILTHRSAVHEDVVRDLVDNLVHGKGFKASKEALEQAYLAEFHKVKSSYYNKLLWDTTKIETLQKPEVRQFGSLDDQKGFNGFFPIPRFLKTVFLKIVEELPVVRLDKLVKGVGGEIHFLTLVALFVL